MHLLDQNMLPELVRTMEPMGDLLQAEQVVLELLELYIQQLLADASVNNNRPLTKEVVEAILTALSHSPAYVDEIPNCLTIHIIINRNGKKMVDRETVIKKLEVLLPAHLRYRIVFQLLCGVGISYTCSLYRFSLDLCGGEYCGEYPDRNMSGKIMDDGLLMESGITSEVFSLLLCGTTPYINMVGEATDRNIAVITTASSAIIKYPLTGTTPQYNVCGKTDGASIVPQVAAEGYHFLVDYCQEDDYCGE